MSWDKTKAALLEVAEDEDACEEGMAWLEKQTNPECLLGAEATREGYMSWAANQLDSHPEFKELLTPTPAQYERGLVDEDWHVRQAWARRHDITPTLAQYERGLLDEDWLVRLDWARRNDITPTLAQYERCLTDEHWRVRQAWAERTDITPTPAQYERGLADEHWQVRRAWGRRHDITPLRRSTSVA